MLLKDYLLGVGRGVRGYFLGMRISLRPGRVAKHKTESNQSNFLASGKVTRTNQSNQSNETNQSNQP